MKKRKIGLLGEVCPFLRHILDPYNQVKTSVSGMRGRFLPAVAHPTYRNIRAFLERRKTRTIQVYRHSCSYTGLATCNLNMQVIHVKSGSYGR